MLFIYVPNGVNIAKWVPEKTGKDFELSPTLKVLQRHRQNVSILSGLGHPNSKGGHSGADTFLLSTGVFRFAGTNTVTLVFVLWMLALWANLASTLDGCLRWLARWPWLAAVLGAIGGPATYWAGAELGAIEFHENTWLSVIVLAVEWGILMPLVLWASERWHGGTVAVSLDEVAS